MRITLNLDEKMIKEAMKITGIKSKSQAINRVLSEFIRYRKREELKALSGKVHIAGNWQELEEIELRAQERSLRDFSRDEIKRFLKEDRIDRATAAKVRRLPGKKRPA